MRTTLVPAVRETHQSRVPRRERKRNKAMSGRFDATLLTMLGSLQDRAPVASAGALLFAAPTPVGGSHPVP